MGPACHSLSGSALVTSFYNLVFQHWYPPSSLGQHLVPAVTTAFVRRVGSHSAPAVQVLPHGT